MAQPAATARRARPAAALVALTVVLAALGSFATPVEAADLFPPGTTGYDRSFPACGLPPPDGPYAFAIIGATGGRAFTHNACLAEQHAVAAASGYQPALYMNLKSPIGSNADQALTGPRGTCQPADAECLAYNFGYKTAQHAVAYATSQQAIASSWWLDVETTSSWSADPATNAVLIGGAIDYLQAQGVVVGIYSAQNQWAQIAGDYRPGLPVWLSAALDAATAPTYCPRTFGGGEVVLVQYFVGEHDLNYACTAADRIAVILSAPLGPAGSAAVVDTTGDCLNVRPQPGFTAGSSACLATGTQVTVIGEAATADGYVWQRIFSLSVSGWVAGTFLRAGTAGTVLTETATLSPPPASRGVNAASWSGGSLTDLVAQAPGATSVWVFEGGRPHGYIVGAPPFANVAFGTLYPSGVLPAKTIVFVVQV
ncbi:MAG: hypothetical protein O3B31_09700 [Chloroflexi bacterium]|nr:hypothetical protein [Chloroflexota bacterium]MDA1003601.1 hypothetical protein [Chloroflexota bacterium]